MKSQEKLTTKRRNSTNYYYKGEKIGFVMIKL